jgi:rubrerythrin
MDGGINAWHGGVAEGPPEAGMAYFSPATSTEEQIALAWMLEDGNRRFYSDITGLLSDKEAQKLFSDLATAEEHHKSSLLSIYLEITGKQEDSDFPASVIGENQDKDIMEGGMSVSDALKWASGKELRDILELSMSLETNAYDLYIKMSREAGDDNSKKVFSSLAEEERQHLNRLSSLL